MARNRQPGSGTGQRDLRAVGRLGPVKAARIQESVGTLRGLVNEVPPIFSAVACFAVVFLVVMFLARSADQPGRRRHGDSR